MEEVYTPKNPHEKAMQRALLQYTNPKNAKLVREALIQAGREDLIGYGRRCLLSPLRGEEKRRIDKRKEELPSHFKKKKKKKTIRNIHKKRRNET